MRATKDRATAREPRERFHRTGDWIRCCAIFDGVRCSTVGAAEGIVRQRMGVAVAWTPCVPSFPLHIHGGHPALRLPKMPEEELADFNCLGPVWIQVVFLIALLVPEVQIALTVPNK